MNGRMQNYMSFYISYAWKQMQECKQKIMKYWKNVQLMKVLHEKVSQEGVILPSVKSSNCH